MEPPPALLTHHPPEWLHPQARQEFHQEVDPAGRFAAHFFGHMHEGTATSTAHGGGHARHALQGASLFGLEEHHGPGGRGVTRPHGFSAGRFELLPGAAQARVRVFPRRMFTSAGGRKIDRDVSAYHLDERGSFAYCSRGRSTRYSAPSSGCSERCIDTGCGHHPNHDVAFR
ncbi:hypothetical protein WME75_32775 [Sorangium sp. So ce1014]|uniref:hypothetical protein n=1 Tax=Sorangium sp. So ce1014 TaxID=3133326 RepID=UPI003F5DAD07